jgi:hypothetical protein
LSTKTAFKGVEYLHCSAFGSYYIECNVCDKRENFQPPLDTMQESAEIVKKYLAEKANRPYVKVNTNAVGTWYLISYNDPYIEEDVSRWVTPESLQFPSFSEYAL